MSDSPETDPRADAVAERLRSGNWYPSEYEGHPMGISRWCRRAAAAVIESIDAADEASGVRRVTAQELADNLELARRQERERLIGEFAKAARVAYKGEGETDARRLLDVAERVKNGYPVGGSNTVETVVRLLRFVADFISVQPTESAVAGIGPAADSPVGGVS